MTVTIERTFDVDAPIERIWEFIADPEQRARAISVVASYEARGDTYVWHLALPIPFVSRTISVKTRDVAREPPTYVRFAGESAVMTLTGEHELEETPDGCRVRIWFSVTGKVPGVEGFFERNIDDEIDNLAAALERHVAA